MINQTGMANIQFIQGKFLLAIIIILLLVSILLAVTNPVKEQHLQAMEDRLSGKDAVTNIINLGILKIKPPQYHNLALISYTKVNDEMASMGLLGYVWVNEKVFK